MPLDNLVLGRVCLHEVHRRSDDRTLITPTYANGLLTLNAKAKSAFVSRVVAAFKSSAQSMEMTIRRYDPGSVLEVGSRIVPSSDSDFLTISKLMADGLADAQRSRQIPGGLVVTFDGRVGHPGRPFFAVMKAELHEGFLKTKDLQATFVDDLFLSPKTKLYKIGFFDHNGTRAPLPGGWSAVVYDSAMTAAQRDNAAHYFHNDFLGLDIPENSAHRVKQFFDSTRNFIKNSSATDEEKVDLYNSLYTYLKVDRSPTIQVSDFADNYFPDELADAYVAQMHGDHFPVGAIEKDLSEVAGSLKLRRLRFPRKIMLSGPPEAISDLVTVETIPADGPAAGGEWTRITIRAPLEGQQ